MCIHTHTPIFMYTLRRGLTWRKPFPGGSSRTRVYLGSWGKSDCCPQSGAGRLFSPPPTDRTARTGWWQRETEGGHAKFPDFVRTEDVQHVKTLFRYLLWRWSSRYIPPGSSVPEARPSWAESDARRETQWQKATSSRLRKEGMGHRFRKCDGCVIDGRKFKM